MGVHERKKDDHYSLASMDLHLFTDVIKTRAWIFFYSHGGHARLYLLVL